MFDIGFLELTLIGAIALLVFGPERLPELARTLGRWVGRLRRMVTSVRNDIERELQLEELEELRKLRQELDPRRASRWLAESRDEFERGFNQTVVNEDDLRGESADRRSASTATGAAADAPGAAPGSDGEAAPAEPAPAPTRSIWDEPGEPVDEDGTAGDGGSTAAAGTTAPPATDTSAEPHATPPADAPADEPADADERR